MNILNKILLGLVAVAILAAVAAIVWLTITPAPPDRFSEFYLLNTEGKAYNYPAQVDAGSSVQVVVGIVNHEAQAASYRVNVVWDNITLQSIEVPDLAQEQKWEGKANFSISEPGENQTVQFYLYKDNGDQPYFKDPLTLRINVSHP